MYYSYYFPLKRLVLGCQRCLVINVGVCGDTIRLRLENQLKVIKSATEDICRDPEPTVVPPATQAPGDMTTGIRFANYLANILNQLNL